MEQFDRQRFGERLFACGHERNSISRHCIGHRCVDTYARTLMRGETLPNIMVLRKICMLFHVRANYLLDLDK